MSTKFRLLALGALSLACVFGNGCVADRPSRNGVFNENQYLRKDFIVRPGDATNADQGWMLKGTIVDASEPNVFGDSIFGLSAGSHNSGDLFHFVVTQDKLQMASNREITTDVGTDPNVSHTGEVINAWPVTNVDLKYRVNLDGEKTNFYEENQELDWQVRQWVKVNFDKNDVSDLAPLGPFVNANVAYCADIANASATLVPGSFFVDEPHEYMEWSVQVTLPIKWTADCYEAFGPMGDAASRLGRTNETVVLKYSMVRSGQMAISRGGQAGVVDKPYTPLIVAEKDPIQKKYGPIYWYTANRDPGTGLLAANQYVVRFDPTKEIRWYFEQGFPTQYLPYFTNNPKVLGNTPALPSTITTIEAATNQVLSDSGAAAKVSFHQYNEPLDDGTPVNRVFGDVRFNMLRWVQSIDQQSEYAGSTAFTIDPRTGEALNSDVVFENFQIQDYYSARIDAYLQSIGASTDSPFNATAWTDPVDAMGNTIACSASNVGQAAPLLPKIAVAAHNGGSTLFQKMQGYLYQPVGQYGPLGPQDFIAPHNNDNNDFYNAYFQVLPYLIYGDPAANPYVTPEGGTGVLGPGQASQALWQMIDKEAQFHQLQADLDHGRAPYELSASTGSSDARAFLDNYQALSINHRNLQYAKRELPFMPGVGRSLTHQDAVTDFSMESIINKDARHCIQASDGSFRWETKQDWLTSLITTYWSQVFWHEFGHTLGLEHNFMGSVDLPNFLPPASGPAGINGDGTKRYGLYSNSVMEYNAVPDRIFWTTGWGEYDRGAIAWIYANNGNGPQGQVPMGMTAKGISGQLSATAPWNDPDGWCKSSDQTFGCTQGFGANGGEKQFLYCNERHMKYTPLCRAGDMGTTPSEIAANEIDNYEWQYKWRNFRQYRKVWDLTNYGDAPLNFVTELRRFYSLWAYDISDSELQVRFNQIGVVPPSSAPSAQFYYQQLTNKFDDEMAHAVALNGAFHEAIVQQTSGQRPYITVFDNYFGDTTQQGIILDKLDAVQSFLALWPVDNYDQTQAAGQYISSYAAFGLSFEPGSGTGIGSLYETVGEQAVLSMIGGSFDAFYYAKPLADAQFTLDTHSFQYLGNNAAPSRQDVQDWTGGWMFTRFDDFLAFFRQIAVANNFAVNIPGYLNIDCTGGIETCTYDPTTPRGYPQDTFFSDTYNQFVGPDGRRYIWVYLRDRNEWFACDRDRNIASWQILYGWTSDVVNFRDDGNTPGGAYPAELQVKYFLDYFTQASHFTP